MSLREVRDPGRQRTDEILDACGAFTVHRRRVLKERVERHADDVRRPTSEAPGCSPECPTQRCGQTDGDLIVHDTVLQFVHCNCSAMHCRKQGRPDCSNPLARSAPATSIDVSRPKLLSALCQNCVRYPLKPGSNTVIYGDSPMDIVVAGSRRSEERWWDFLCVATRGRHLFPSVLLQPLGHLSVYNQ